MDGSATRTPPLPVLEPEGMFVIHVRSDSGAARKHLVGRVEHVKSGTSEAFASLAALLGFIERHVPTAKSSTAGSDSKR